MSLFENLKAEIKDSISTLMGINGPSLINEETNMAYNKTIKTRMAGIIRNTRVNKSRDLMDAIAAAIDSDEEKDTDVQKEAPFKLTKRMSSKKMLMSTSNKMPSATSLLNKPFADRDVVRGEESINYYEFNNFSSITGKDLNRSLGSGMVGAKTAGSKLRKGNSKQSLKKLSRVESIQSIINAPLSDDTISNPRQKPNFSSLGVTATDLDKTFYDGLENALSGAEAVKEGASIAELVNGPLNEEYGSNEDITIPIKELSLQQSVASLIQGEPKYFIASKDELEMEKNQSTTVNIPMDEQSEPFLNAATLNVPQYY